ncbi:MAG TPA: helix-turn-helix domain-containing protein [Candidatus Rifleibacterium sp.]|nr:helix-turn-helix domain-containing protein [Candidatus Rifleibacterium sp.]
MKNKIKHLLKVNGLTQAELGERIGVPQSTVASWVTGRGNPKHDSLLKLSKAFGVSMEFFTEDSAEAAPGINRIPVVDEIPSGNPRDAKEFHRNEILMHESTAKLYDFGYLVQDKFMENAGIMFLDIVFIKYGCPAEDGVIFLLELDGKAMLARVFLEYGRITLKKEFNGARPVSIDSNNQKRLRLVGKVTGLFRPDIHIYEDPEQG